MSDYLPESPFLATLWCPGCRPDQDPTKEILEVRWCHLHSPSTSGSADGEVPYSNRILASVEADGHDCAAIHRLLYGDE